MVKKICSKCKQEKELNSDNFHREIKFKDGFSYRCKICARKANKKYYINNKERLFKKYKEVYQSKSDLFSSFKKEKECLKCGENRHYCLDFHHLIPSEKQFTVSNFYRKNPELIEKLKNELKKCILLCSNCHREFHYLNNREEITIEEYLK